jgi:hypothetical protein
MRKQFPGTATANGIEDAGEDLAAALFWRPTQHLATQSQTVIFDTVFG